jgi:uncharacterized protein YceH (UPF0502 family)
MERTPPLAAVLPRQPGTKESRYAHLLSGPIESAVAAFTAGPAPAAGPASAPHVPVHDTTLSADAIERITRLEATIAELRQEMAALRQKIDDLFGDG